MRFRELMPEDYTPVESIGRNLGHTKDGKGWFTIDACTKHIPADIRKHKGFVAVEGKKILGFVTYLSNDQTFQAPMVTWIGVEIGQHRKGIGAGLIKIVENEVFMSGSGELYVETPTKEAGMGSDYESTYKFYMGMGFKLANVILKDTPENNCDCDMAVLKKVLK